MKIIKFIENKFSQLYNNTFGSIEFLKKTCFFVGLTCIFIYNCFDYNLILFTTRTFNTFLYLGIILLVLKILLTKEKLTTYLKYLFYILMAVICDNIIESRFILLTVILYMISSKQLDIKSIFKYIFIFNSLVLIINMFVYFMNQFIGFNLLNLQISNYIYRGNSIRHSLYFYHPNAFSFYLFWTYITYIYLHWDDYTLKNRKKLSILFGISILFALFCFTATQTRIACLLFLVSVPLLLIFKNKKFQNNQIFELLTTTMYLIIFSFSFLLLLFYKQDNIFGLISMSFDNLLSGRINLGHIELLDKGITLLGNNIPNFANFVVDNGYYHILIKYGIVFTLFFGFLIFKASCKSYERKDFKTVYVLVLFCIYNFIEALLVHPQACIIYAILGLFI